jgi:hypothetical protein
MTLRPWLYSLPVVACALGSAASPPAPAIATTTSTRPTTLCRAEAFAFVKNVAVQMSIATGLEDVTVSEDGPTRLVSSNDDQVTWEVPVRLSESPVQWPAHAVFHITFQTLDVDACFFDAVKLTDYFL